NETEDYEQALYLLVQLQLRDIVGELAIDDLLARRREISTTLQTGVTAQAAQMGIALIMVGIKDIMFPGELKTIFAQIVSARKEGLASLERARGETAALRSLANAAKLLEDNPALLQLRLIQSLSTGDGNTVVLVPSFDALKGIAPGAVPPNNPPASP
ncbi:MAG: hypothetical protein HY866_12510, partial [Chloroflexi bacterium]|nr:hypothetical protein [Chloroflexota bacterium]